MTKSIFQVLATVTVVLAANLGMNAQQEERSMEQQVSYRTVMVEGYLHLLQKRRNSLTAADVEDVLCDVFQGAFDFAGGGDFGSKDHPQVKEQGDYNLKYLIAAALEEARIQAPDAQALLMRVEIRPDERFSARYPHELSARVTIRTKDQRIFVKEQNGYEGGLTNPMSWERTVEKFDWLTEGFADEELRGGIIEAVERLDTLELSDLTDLLAQVHPTATFPIAHPGIQ